MSNRKQKKPAKPTKATRDNILKKPPQTARQVVVRVLEHFDETGEFFSDRLQILADQAKLSSVDRRLAREITAGVIRRRATLDALITPHVKRPQANVEVPLWRLLQIGVYELAFLDSIPAHASVNETTELARFLRRPRWTGFLNGTLRSVARGLSEEVTDSPAADAFPLKAGRYRKCAAAWFPDPETAPLDYFAAAFSFPMWLAERWSQRLESSSSELRSPLPSGERQPHCQLFDLGFWFNEPPRLTLRVNRLKTSREAVLKTFSQENITAEAGEMPDSIVLGDTGRVTELPGFAEGHFSVQDQTAMRVVDWLDPKPGESIWDVCAAPGTKTAGIAERMQNQGRVLATDIDSDRLKRVEENRSRLGLEIVETRQIAASGENLPEGPFDAVLVDAPCSNTGVLGKRVEARWRLRPRDLEELPQIQFRLLANASQRVKTGGRLVYSTCSIEPEENRAVVDDFLKSHPDWELVSDQIDWPGRPSDGGYAAVLRFASNARRQST